MLGVQPSVLGSPTAQTHQSNERGEIGVVRADMRAYGREEAWQSTPPYLTYAGSSLMAPAPPMHPSVQWGFVEAGKGHCIPHEPMHAAGLPAFPHPHPMMWPAYQSHATPYGVHDLSYEAARARLMKHSVRPLSAPPHEEQPHDPFGLQNIESRIKVLEEHLTTRTAQASETKAKVSAQQ